MRDRENQRRLARAWYERNKALTVARAAKWAKEHPEASRDAKANWQKRHPETILPRVRRWKSKNPQKVRAHHVIKNEIRMGRMRRQPCEECGSKRSHAHHDDYAKPLEVKWLCAKHHKEHERKVKNATDSKR